MITDAADGMASGPALLTQFGSVPALAFLP
jgi:hypothetical protein